MIFPANKLGFKILFYDLDDELEPINEFRGSSIILLIHFFGKKIKNINQIKKSFPENSKIIEDFTHIFLNNNLLRKKNGNDFFFFFKKTFWFYFWRIFLQEF